MPGKPSDRHGATDRIDLKGLNPGVARTKALQVTFKVKPGARLRILVDSAEVEKELLRWIDEMGHRLLKVLRPGDDGVECVTIEMLKMERRR